MRARELVQPFPTVQLDDDAREAAQRMAEDHRPGLIVLDEAGRPCAVLPGGRVALPVVDADATTLDVVVLGIAVRNRHPISSVPSLCGRFPVP